MLDELDEWRDAEIARFADALRQHAARAGGTAVRTARETQRDDGQEARAPAFAATKVRLSEMMAHEAAAAPAGGRPSLQDVRIAARRVTTFEAAARRRRTWQLSQAICRPIVHDWLREWRRTSLDGYRALRLRNEHAYCRALSRWWDSYLLSVRAAKARWLRRWWCVCRAAAARDTREAEVAEARRRRLFRRLISRLRCHCHISALASRAASNAWLENQLGLLRRWRRVAVARASALRCAAWRRAMRVMSAYAVAEQRRAHGAARIAFSGWRRRLHTQTSRRLLGAAMRALKLRCAARQLRVRRDGTMRLAATWTAARSVCEGVLARLLLEGWRRRKRLETWQRTLQPLSSPRLRTFQPGHTSEPCLSPTLSHILAFALPSRLSGQAHSDLHPQRPLSPSPSAAWTPSPGGRGRSSSLAVIGSSEHCARGGARLPMPARPRALSLRPASAAPST